MFKYEDMDFQSLTTSLDIENPDGPEELYAMAQFCRMGKGTQASEENYRFYLQRAADAGSEQAKQELDALDNADAASAAEPPEEARAVEGMSLPELMQAADNGNPYALLPLAKKAMSSEFHDLPKAKQWLEKAAALAPQGVYSDEDATKIYITLGRLLKKPEFDTPENRAACHRYYSLAAELGSGEAFDELSDQYEKGYGCTADPEKAKLYAARGDNRNDPAIMIFRGIAKIQSSKNLMDLVADISRIRKASDDRDILAFADLLAAAAGFEPLKPETAQWAWDHEHGGDISIPIHTNAHFNGIPGDAQNLTMTFRGTTQMLAMAYGTDPEQAAQRGLPVDAHKAGLLSSWMPKQADAQAWATYGAAKNEPQAMYILACNKANGVCGEKDPQGAFALCLKAAEAGFVPAQESVAKQYAIGSSVPVDHERAAYWAEKAAAGDENAKCEMGKLYYFQLKDYQKAKYWLEKAAEKNVSEALNTLGMMYNGGLGVPADLNKARDYYQKAADANNKEACFNLAELYAEGQGVPKNTTLAAKLYQKAVDLGDTTAAPINLSVLYRQGNGVPKNPAKAAQLLQIAVDDGNAIAANILAGMYRNGEGVPRNLYRAYVLYTQAEKGGFCNYLALCDCYMLGLGIGRNYDLAYS